MTAVLFKIGFYFNCICLFLPIYRALPGLFNGGVESWFEILKANMWTLFIFGGLNAISYYLYHKTDSKIAGALLASFPLWAGIGLLCWYLYAFSGKN